MATTPQFKQYLADCVSSLDVTFRSMMGEYLVYYKGKLVGDLADNRLLIKQTPTSQAMLADCPTEYPYEGSKSLMFVVDNFEDVAFMQQLFEGMFTELPDPKPKKTKKK